MCKKSCPIFMLFFQEVMINFHSTLLYKMDQDILDIQYKFIIFWELILKTIGSRSMDKKIEYGSMYVNQIRIHYKMDPDSWIEISDPLDFKKTVLFFYFLGG